MKENYILILGAGLMQKPAIQSGKELGYKIALVDGNPNALCVPMADIFSPIDLKDKEAIFLIVCGWLKIHSTIGDASG